MDEGGDGLFNLATSMDGVGFLEVNSTMERPSSTKIGSTKSSMHSLAWTCLIWKSPK